MDWKIFFTTFSAIFLAELADKTQLVGITLSAKSGRPLMVFCGSISAYILVTLISVIIGSALANYIKPEVIKAIGGAIFVGMGVLILLGKI
jgi:putative Ca2+/H+ antiporter (TMEM165/GDT1 family)